MIFHMIFLYHLLSIQHYCYILLLKFYNTLNYYEPNLFQNHFRHTYFHQNVLQNLPLYLPFQHKTHLKNYIFLSYFYKNHQLLTLYLPVLFEPKLNHFQLVKYQFHLLVLTFLQVQVLQFLKKSLHLQHLVWNRYHQYLK